MSNFITYDPSLNATMFEKTANAIGVAAEWTANAVQSTALESGIVTINAVRRTERVVTTLVKAAPSIWEQAGIKADARIAARLARHGVKLN